MGASSAPLATPFSQRSHQRSASAWKSMRGFGQAKCGYLWIQGPRIARRRAQSLDGLHRRVAVAVRPASDDERRNLHGREILANGAVPPVAVAALVREPLLQVEGLAAQAFQPHVAP